MKTSKLLALSAAAAIAVGGILIFNTQAAPGPQGPFGRGPVLKRIIENLQLDETQVEKIKAELRAEKDTIAPMVKSLYEARKGLRETIQSGADETAIRAASATVAVVEADLAVQRAKLHHKIKPILTEEQIAKAQEMEAKMDNFVFDALKHLGEKL